MIFFGVVHDTFALAIGQVIKSNHLTIAKDHSQKNQTNKQTIDIAID
jgi:hypothetical protein